MDPGPDSSLSTSSSSRCQVPEHLVAIKKQFLYQRKPASAADDAGAVIASSAAVTTTSSSMEESTDQGEGTEELHMDDVAEAGGSSSGGGGGRGGGGGGGGGGGVCFAFQKGECSRGDACRFSHDSSGGGGHKTDSRDNRDNNRDKKETGRNKKRPRENHKPTDFADRLCTSVIRGIPCTYPKCDYSHDPLDYLSRKPTDIGPICYQYVTYGLCNNGIMCRYGTQHIDYATGQNQRRPTEEGGVIEREESSNVLKKDIQVLLRKKKYPFTKYKPSQHRKDSGTTSTVSAELAVVVDSVHETEIKVESSVSVAAEESSVPMPVVLAAVEKKEVPYDLHTGYPSVVKLVDFTNKVYVAPLTTVGNLPFRRVMKDYGADITCGEMAMSLNLVQGQASEWALLRRHPSEKEFGIQVAASHPEHMAQLAQLLEKETFSSFVDLNSGCPIDTITSRGCGSALLTKPQKLVEVVAAMCDCLPSRQVTVKIRTGWDEKKPMAHKLIPMLQKMSHGRIAAVMIHGRSRSQRYSKDANWDYILEAARSQDPDYPRLPVIGNGDIFSWEDWKGHLAMMADPDSGEPGLCPCAMIGRGALIKPWLPQEIKEQRLIDISATERLEMLKSFVNYGLEHWGSDTQGVATTRRFLLEWLSFLHRYVPLALTERIQKMQQRPPHFFGRCDLETLLASSNSNDWVKISEMLLGPVSDGFDFLPKHKSNSYAPEAGSAPDTESVSNG